MDTPKKILIVEDEKPLANAMSLKLTASGFTTTVVYNGDEALALLEKEKYDLTLIDIMMPKRDGFSVLEELKTKNMSISVFVMSNLGQAEDLARAKALGVADYIVKSNTPLAEIVERIKAYFNKNA
jgi:DNA-binding response OmpR family regulator